MNERIRELAEQAGMKPCADMSKFGMNEDMNPYNCQEFMLEKFAELLVRECAELHKDIPMRICGYTDDQNNPYYKGYQLGYYDGLIDLNETIKNHFVVTTDV